MILAILVRPLWWTVARMGLCLGGVDDDELQRLRSRRLGWMLVTGGAAAFLIVLAGAASGAHLTAAGTGASAESLALSTLAGMVLYGLAGVPALLCVAIWLYVGRKIRRARRDRERYPEVCRGTVRRLMIVPDGGWPVLIRSDRGRWMWLTGSEDALRLVRRRLPARRDAASVRFTVTLTHYPKCRVVHTVTGMAVEQLDAVLAAQIAAAPSPA